MLREAMKREPMITRLSKEISHGEVKEGAYFLFIDANPSVRASHGESQRHYKLLTMVS
jgi:hypothetical protein